MQQPAIPRPQKCPQQTHLPDSHLCHLLATADIKGPRFGIGLCIGLTAPAVYCIGLCTTATGFIISRLFIGFSLATFVACQFWCTSMFNTKVVGAANALAAGWVSLPLEISEPRVSLGPPPWPSLYLEVSGSGAGMHSLQP